ncbi:Hypothetical predicted protein, partial [Pelobates cultripes]
MELKDLLDQRGDPGHHPRGPYTSQRTCGTAVTHDESKSGTLKMAEAKCLLIYQGERSQAEAKLDTLFEAFWWKLMKKLILPAPVVGVATS